MASREWMITKIVMLVVGLITIVSICVGAANIVVNMQGDIDDANDDIYRIEGRVEKHIDTDLITFREIDVEIDSLKEKNHSIELAMSEQTVRFNYIVEELRELNGKIDQLEVVE